MFRSFTALAALAVLAAPASAQDKTAEVKPGFQLHSYTLQFRGGPPNDNLANAETIAVPGTATGTNASANGETNEAPASCTFGGVANDEMNAVWYTFTPAESGTVGIDLEGSDFDTSVSLWTGTSHPLTEVACNDDDPTGPFGDLTSRIDPTPVTAGTQYYIRVGAYAGDEGAIALAVTAGGGGPGGAPENDAFADATVFTQDGEYLSSTVNATSEAGEPTVSCATGDSGQSVWFTFTAGASGPATFDTNGSIVATPPGPAGQFTDTIMTLYTGSALGSLAEVACNDDDPGNPTGTGDFTSRIVTTVTAGTTYYVRVSSYVGGNREDGEVRLTVTGTGLTSAAEPGSDARTAMTAFPNPVRDAARVRVEVAQTQDVTVAVYDVTGRQVATLFSGPAAAGRALDLTLDASALPAGVYVVRAEGAFLQATQRVTVSH